MADTKITQLQPPQVGYPVVPATDVLPIVVIADPGMATSGSTRKVTVNQILGAGGTATLASATITGDLTVDTSTLKVDSTNDRVGIGTATPYALLHANGTIAAANFDWTPSFIAPTVGLLAASNSSSASIRIATLDSNPTHDPFVNFLTSGGQNWSIGIDNSDSDKFKIAFTNGFTGSNEVFAVDTSAVFSWYDGAGGTRMTLNSTGLGVGVASPLGRLHIVKTGAGIQDAGYFENSQAAAADVGPRASLLGVGSVAMATIESGWNGAANTDAYFAIRTRGSGAVTERLRIDSSGNVGIGVTPRALVGATRVEIKGSNSANLSLRSGSANASARDWMVASNVVAFGDFVVRQGASQGAEPNSGTDRMYFDPSGNIIITPTSTPPTLTVNGQIAINATSNTNLRFSYRGSDGVTRVANITLA